MMMTSNGQQADNLAVRCKMQNFWKEHSTKANEEEMMLDSDADTLGREEVPEILSLLPGLEGKSVLELGAGIGRFSGRIAAKAKSVVAVDFMENFIKCNESTNGHHGNIQFVQADVMLLKFPENSFDLVFSNWLLMYLEEDEVCTLFERIFNWLKPGGHFFFRESCFHQSGNKSRTCNPSKYRHPSTYNDILGSLSSFLLTSSSSSSQASSPCATYGVKLVFSKPIQTYIKLKSSRNQISWLAQKVSRGANDSHLDANFGSFRVFYEHLNKSFIDVEVLYKMEDFFGSGNLSSGDIEIFQSVGSLLRLKEGYKLKVLQLNSGLGKVAFHIAQKYDASVLGVTPVTNAVALSVEKANKLNEKRVQFEVCDMEEMNMSESLIGSFDLVLSLTPLILQNPIMFFTQTQKFLKQNGQFLFVACCSTEKNHCNSGESYHDEACEERILHCEDHIKLIHSSGLSLEHQADVTNVVLQAFQRNTINADQFLNEEMDLLQRNKCCLIAFVCVLAG